MHICQRNKTRAASALIQADRNNKQAIFKNCAPFTNCITEKK